MTDLIGSLLNQMSSVFNETKISTPINIQEDPSLKWKSLINNNFAKKEKDGVGGNGTAITGNGGGGGESSENNNSNNNSGPAKRIKTKRRSSATSTTSTTTTTTINNFNTNSDKMEDLGDNEDDKTKDNDLTISIEQQQNHSHVKEALRAKINPSVVNVMKNDDIKEEEKEENSVENQEKEKQSIISATTIEANIDENNLLIDTNECSGGSSKYTTIAAVNNNDDDKNTDDDGNDDDLKNKKKNVIDDDKKLLQIQKDSATQKKNCNNTNNKKVITTTLKVDEIVMLNNTETTFINANELQVEQKGNNSISKNDTTTLNIKIDKNNKPLLPSNIETATPIHSNNISDKKLNDENLFLNSCDGVCIDDDKRTANINFKLTINPVSTSSIIAAATITTTTTTLTGSSQNNNSNKNIDKTIISPPSDRNLRSNRTTITNTTNTIQSQPTASTSAAASNVINSNNNNNINISKSSTNATKSTNIMTSSDDKKLDELDENENGDSNSSQTTLRKGRGRTKVEIGIDTASKSLNTTPTKTKDLKQSENVSEQQEKRGRIRTRRTLENSTDEKLEEIPEAEEKKIETEPKKEEETPKRRGRSRKLMPSSQSSEKSTTDANTVEDPIKSEKCEGEIKKDKDSESQENPKRKRGRSKKPPNSETDAEQKVETSIDLKEDSVTSTSEENKPRLIMTIRTHDTVPKIVTQPQQSNQPPQIETTITKSEPEIKIVRKRGRRPRPVRPVKKSPRNLTRDSSETILASAIARKEKQNEQVLPPALRNRSLRRIKPTAKILANDELRQGFEIQNCVRLSISSENLEHSDKSPAKSPEIHQEPKPEKKPVETKMEPPKAPVKGPSEAAKNQQNQTQLMKTTNLILDNIYTKTKQSRSTEEFLNEIKNSKLGSNRSLEDNKKLNKKQQRKLFKMKVKHFSMLGLRRTTKTKDDGDASSSSAESSDAEEFVPTKFSKQDISKPNITLRLRNQRSEKISEDKAPGRKTNNTIKRTIGEGNKTSNAEKRIKLTNETQNSTSNNNNSQSDDDCVLVETAQTQTNFRNATSVNNGNKENNHQNLICYCLSKTKYCIKQQQKLPFSVDGKIYCCAIDEIEKRKIGCTNELTGDLINLYRPSVRVSYMILCTSHKKRLSAHNCCAGCGVFCTQGVFVVCSNKHFFHRECAIKYILNAPYDPNNPHYTGPTLALKCPHCGVDAPNHDYKVAMRCENLPLFVPNRNNLPKPAKMSIQIQKQIHQNFLMNIEKLIPNSVILLLKNSFDKMQLRKTQPSSSSAAPIDTSTLFNPKDFFYALYLKDGDEKVSDIIASGFNLLTPFKDFHNGTCLHLVSNFGSITMAYLILCRANSEDFINLKDKEMRTAAMCAVVGGKNDILKLLCLCGADVTIKGPDGMTILHLAAKVGNNEATQIILEHYRQTATAMKLNKFINMTDDGSWTALVWAAEHGHTEIVNYLMSLGADPNICDAENNTVVHWAALSGKSETIYPLLSNCDINTQNVNGDTALHIACRQSNTRTCLLLLANGANLSIKNVANETPYDCIQDESSQCARLLKFNKDLRNIGIGGWTGSLGEKLVLSNDISNGREVYPIQLMKNLETGDDTVVPDFKYITKNILMQNTIQIDQRISQMRICSCSDSCISDSCQCGQISLQSWYGIDGKLITDFNYADPPMLFECNDVCGCNKIMCRNRVVQNGTKLPLTVFECDDKQKGFGVKCSSRISKGTFVAQYTGELLTDHEADRRTDDSYFFDLGASDHCIDANFFGNVSRFFNHSCEPNVVPVRVYFEHQDFRFPKIAFFASRDIDVGEEIAFDYGEKFWVVKYKFFTCLCKSPKCRYSAETILNTIEEYNQRNNVISID